MAPKLFWFLFLPTVHFIFWQLENTCSVYFKHCTAQVNTFWLNHSFTLTEFHFDRGGSGNVLLTFKTHQQDNVGAVFLSFTPRGQCLHSDPSLHVRSRSARFVIFFGVTVPRRIQRAVTRENPLTRSARWMALATFGARCLLPVTVQRPLKDGAVWKRAAAAASLSQNSPGTLGRTWQLRETD